MLATNVFCVGSNHPTGCVYDFPPCLSITLNAPEYVPPLPAAVEVALYRIAQEALTNVVRHAHAQHCVLTLEVDNDAWLEVRDDGQGLPADYRAGVGLTSMRERARQHQGQHGAKPGWERYR